MELQSIFLLSIKYIVLYLKIFGHVHVVFFRRIQNDQLLMYDVHRTTYYSELKRIAIGLLSGSGDLEG